MASPPGAVEAPLPDRLAPQLATLVRAPPSTGEWTYELKFDGYRLMARLDGAPQLLTRSGIDWTAKMPALASELAALGLAATWLDAEAVVLGDNGQVSMHCRTRSTSGGPMPSCCSFSTPPTSRDWTCATRR